MDDSSKLKSGLAEHSAGMGISYLLIVRRARTSLAEE
jgi:hypothetical protein